MILYFENRWFIKFTLSGGKKIVFAGMVIFCAASRFLSCILLSTISKQYLPETEEKIKQTLKLNLNIYLHRIYETVPVANICGTHLASHDR